jgi:hypothetical protein
MGCLQRSEPEISQAVCGEHPPGFMTLLFLIVKVLTLRFDVFRKQHSEDKYARLDGGGIFSRA